jgi:hypothetical protein
MSRLFLSRNIEDGNGRAGVHRLPWRQARGPCWARAMLGQCLQSQRYYLQIDSHMRFVQDWGE